MTNFLLHVSYTRNTFPEYRMLLDELRRIPDVTVRPEALVSGTSSNETLVNIDVFEWISATEVVRRPASIVYQSSQIIVYINGEEVERDYVNNNQEAVEHMAFYTSILLTRLTGNMRYLETREVRENIDRITIVRINVNLVTAPKQIETAKIITQNIKCVPVNIYEFFIEYYYPHTYREVQGYAICCAGKKWILFVIKESETGQWPSSRYITIRPPEGTECTRENIENVIVRGIERIEFLIRQGTQA